MSPRYWARLVAGIALLAFSNDAISASVPLPGEALCPDACDVVGSNPQNWTTFTAVNRLHYCQEPMLLDFALFTSIGGKNGRSTAIRACTPSDAPPSDGKVTRSTAFSNETTTAAVEMVWSKSPDSLRSAMTSAQASRAVQSVRSFLTEHIRPSSLFYVHNQQAVGVYAGAFAKETVLGSTVFEDFLGRLESTAATDSLLLQVCGAELSADMTFGMFIASGDDASLETQLVAAQGAVAGWAKGGCASLDGETTSLGNVSLPALTPTKVERRMEAPHRVLPRAACKTILVEQNDLCSSLAKKCGISLSDFQKYNPGSSFCTGLQVTQPVCCGAGTLPTPQQQADGTCASYVVESGTWCAKIAAANGVSVSDLDKWNKDTWGWGGCDDLKSGVKMCISSGKPPMPAPMKGAVCGPQVSGTAQPTDGTKLADLNQCPLKACCDIWGQCGTTDEFCTPSGKGNPGTALPGENGCFSNCGTDVIIGDAPSQFRAIAYFEGWNPSRPCMKMDVSEIDESKYTHIHFSFAHITRGDWKVKIPDDTQAQFEKFVTMKTSLKKILSFGGWTFSTAVFDYDIFRSAMKPENRAALADNVAKFILDNNLDGVDFDWEYPGAPDLPNIPAGSPDDAPNYLKFLTTIKSKLKGKSLSIAAPASFWYLKAFPIAQMSKVVDYIVYMTYDLHGQWDFGSKYSIRECEKGDCLRSHVNLTETVNALSMITKAGVPSGQILVGVSSYGRSFKMTTPGCTGPMCKYVGPDSAAAKGLCTDTAGYISNAEIELLASNAGSKARKFEDKDSDSDIMVYEDVQWVAYMTEERKANRKSLYKALHMGGISDWAVDLQRMSSPNNGGSGNGNSSVIALSAVVPVVEGCNDAEKSQVLYAWRESVEMSRLLNSWVPGGRWQSALDMYMGSDSSKDGKGNWFDPGPIQTQIILNYQLHNARWGDWPRQHYGWIYCNPESRPGGSKDDKGCDGARAYTFDSLGKWWSGHYIVLCPDWWDPKKTLDLQGKLLLTKGDTATQKKMETWRGIRSRSLLHETYHWNMQSGYEIPTDLAVDPLEIAYLALPQNKGTEWARKNVESYAISAMAIYIMNHFGWKDPPKPERWPYTSSTPPTSSGKEDLVYTTAPNDWVAPVSIDSQFFTWSKEDHPNAVSLDDVGDWMGNSGGECWQDEKFFAKEQCEGYCQWGKCSEISNPVGNEKWLCASCPSPGDDCSNRDYDDWWSCRANCGGSAKCAYKEGDSVVTCSGCTASTVCKEGSFFDDFNKCGDECHGGACSQKAGEKVKCIYCPTS